jgi:hypothetical protein
MSKRAIRRHHRQRIWQKRRRYYGGEFDPEEGWVASAPRKRMVINTAKLCSCAGCSQNWGRRHMSLVTRQEQLAELEEQEERQELDI